MRNLEQEIEQNSSQITQKEQFDSQQPFTILRNFILNGKTTCFLNEQNNKLIVSMYFMLLGVSAFNISVTQDLISDRAEGSIISWLIQEFYDQKILYGTVFFGLILLKVLLFLSASMQIILKQEVLVVSWINRKCANNFGILKQLDLSLSGFMVLVNWRENIVQLIVSGAINLFYAVYLQQYIDRKDLLYVSSSNQYILFRIYLLLSSFANCLFLILKNESYFILFCLITLGLLLTWYLVHGHQLYTHNFSKNAFLVVVSLILTIYWVIIQSWIFNKSFINFGQVTKCILSFSILTFFIVSRIKTINDRKLSLLNLKKDGLKSKDLYLLQLLQETATNKNSQALLLGILHCQYETKCDILIEYFKDGKVYDPYLKESFHLKDLCLQKESAVRFYIKSLYETSLKQEETIDKLLEYCQFLVNQFSNIEEAIQLIKRARLLSLDIVKRVKLAKMESFLKQHHDKLNMQIFDGKLEIEHIIESEQTFHQIEQKINHYILGSLDVWSSLQLQEIEMSEIRNALKREMKTIEEINGLWKGISKFFKVNKAWRFIYLHYIMFIQNERIKQKELDLFVSDAEEQSIFNSQAIYFKESTAESKLFDPEIMFNQNSCCLFAAIQEGQLLIKDVNSRFTKTLGYSKQEIKGSPLSAIMPTDIVAEHNAKFKEWVNSGYLSNEASYHPKFTFFITKENKQIPAVKYYKAHYSIERGLEFACLLKSNEKSKVIEHHQNKSQLFPEPIRQQFEESSQTSFKPQKNIFLKQQTLQPNKTTSEIKYFKLSARGFTLLMILAILVLAGMTNIQSQSLNNYSTQFITLMSIYRFPIILSTNYMKQFLKIGNIAKVNAMIASASTQYLQFVSKSTTAKTLFDTNLNPPNNYKPYYNYNITNKENLSHIDLFYSMVSSISTLNTTNVNRTSQEYRFFNTYLKPSYDEMMNITKYELHKTFGKVFQSAINQQVLFMAVQSTVLVIFIIILFKLIHSFISKMRNIFIILLNFHPSHVIQTHNYWKQVKKSFNKLFLQFEDEAKPIRQPSTVKAFRQLDTEERTNQRQASLNIKTKHIKEGTQRKRFQAKLRVLLVLIMLSILVIAVGIQFSLMTDLQKLYVFENDGFFFLRYFPIGPIVAMGCIEKYYSDQFPQEIAFNPKKYEEALSTMFIFGHNNNYIGEIADPNSVYYTKQKNYFFGSPCEYNPSILTAAGVTVEKCLSICNGTFKQGISTYLRYGQKLGENCILNKTSLTSAQLDEFTLAGTILSGYVLDAIVTWTSEFTQKVADLQAQNLKNSLIIISIILSIHFLIKEHWLIAYIEGQYNFVKQIYLRFVPEFILVKEKVIKQKFIIEGIISN